MGLEERAQKEKPHVKILYSANAPQELCREVELGLEEEGIPGVRGAEATGGGAAELAYAAAQASPLATGVGIAPDGLAVHYSRLPREHPLFFLPRGECTPAQARRLGANAARLVKGIPFKEKEDPPAEASPQVEPTAEDDDLPQLVTAVVQRVLAALYPAAGGEGSGTTSTRTH